MKKDDFFKRIPAGPDEGTVLGIGRRENTDISTYFEPRTEGRFDYFHPTQEQRRHIRPKLQKSKGVIRQSKRDSGHFQEEKRIFLNCLVDFNFGNNRMSANENYFSEQPEKLFEKINKGELRNVFITGSIGCGKTTYLTKLLHLFHAKNDEGTYVFTINIHTFSDFMVEKMSPEEKILAMISEEINRYLKLNSKIMVNSLDDFWTEFGQKFPKYKVVFVFDNIDAVYDEVLKKIFLTELNNDEERKKYVANCSLTKALISFRSTFNSQFLPSENHKVSFVYAMRPHTYMCINNRGTKDVAENPIKQDVLISLSVRNREFVQAILTKRVEEYKKESEKKESEKKESEKKESEIEEKHIVRKLSEFAARSTEHSLHGLRHAMNNLSIVAPKMVSKRTVTAYPEWMTAMFLFLDNRRSYSQNTVNGISGVVNIFLVNAQFRIDSQREKFPELMLQEHRQSYWLKYFIVCAIHEQTKDIRNELDRFFQDEDVYNRCFRKYQKHIYKLCIYSLSEVSHGRLIACESGDQEKFDYRLWASYRLRQSMKRKLFFSFEYLSVVVDDAYLEFPNILISKITRRQIYKSFFPNSTEMEEWKKWLKISVLKVFIFLQILESSLENYEKDYIDGRLYEIYKPNFEKIKKKIDSTIESIGKDLSFTEKEIAKLIDKSNKIVADEKSNLDDFFSEYKEDLLTSPK